MCSFSLPFTGKNQKQLVEHILTDEYIPINICYKQEFRMLINNLLKKNPEYDSVIIIRDRLEIKDIIEMDWIQNSINDTELM